MVRTLHSLSSCIILQAFSTVALCSSGYLVLSSLPSVKFHPTIQVTYQPAILPCFSFYIVNSKHHPWDRVHLNHLWYLQHIQQFPTLISAMASIPWSESSILIITSANLRFPPRLNQTGSGAVIIIIFEIGYSAMGNSRTLQKSGEPWIGSGNDAPVVAALK